ncbi:MAG: hypothetical protein ACE5D4_10730, partial [Thermodesulfobacteriota bacterium]
PLSKLIWVDWRHAARIPYKIDSPKNQALQRRDVCPVQRSGVIRRSYYDRGNESVTDFAYALALIRRNYTREQVIENIRRDRTDWNNHSGEKRKNAYLRAN